MPSWQGRPTGDESAQTPTPSWRQRRITCRLQYRRLFPDCTTHDRIALPHERRHCRRVLALTGEATIVRRATMAAADATILRPMDDVQASILGLLPVGQLPTCGYFSEGDGRIADAREWSG